MTNLQSSVVTRAPAEEENELARRYPGQSGLADPTPAPTDGPDQGRAHAHSIVPTDERPARTFRVPDVPLRQLAGLALVGIGVLIVLFLVYLFAFTPLSASRNQQRLAQSVTGKPLFRYSLVAGHDPAGRIGGGCLGDPGPSPGSGRHPGHQCGGPDEWTRADAGLGPARDARATRSSPGVGSRSAHPSVRSGNCGPVTGSARSMVRAPSSTGCPRSRR